MLESIITSISLGFLSSASPCLLPLYPGFLAYLGGMQDAGGLSRYWLGAFVLAGVLTMMVALGLLIALLSVSVGAALSVAIPLSDTLIILLGVLLVLNVNPFKRLPQIQAPLIRNPLANAFIYGLLYGPLALPCSGPLVVGIFALSFNATEALSKLTVFIFYGLGFGLPLLLLSLLAGTAQHRIAQWLARHSKAINIISGILLIGIGGLDLLSNWDLISTKLG